MESDMMQRHELGVDLGGTKVLLVAGKVQFKAPTGKSFSPIRLKAILNEFILENQLHPTTIGIAVPGLIQENKVFACDVLPEFNAWDPCLDWDDMPYTIGLSNDVKAALYGEFPDITAEFCGGIIMVGTAIGAAFVSNGHEIRGSQGWAGELGYFPILTVNGVKRLDELSGGQFLADKLGLNPGVMAKKALDGEQIVLQEIHNAGQYLGLAIAGIINLLNPTQIAVGGGTLGLPGFWDAMNNMAKENTIPTFWKEGVISKVQAGEQVAAIGAVRRLRS